MPDYFYDMDLVVDPLNPSNVVAKGQVAIYDPADTAGTTLLALKDPSGLPLPNPLTSNANGFLPPRTATLPQTLWKSGGFEGYFNSFKGLRDEAVSAVAAAQGAADAATTAVAEVVTTAAVDGAGALVLTKANGTTVNAGSVRGPQGIQGAPGQNGSNVLPTDTAIQQAITTPGTATATALSATYGPAVQAAAPELKAVFAPSRALSIGNKWVTLGDSNTAGYIANAAADRWPNYLSLISKGRFQLLHNAGVGGNTTAQMRTRIATDVVPHAPNGCTVMGGTNDIITGVPIATFKTNIRGIIGDLRAAGIAPVLCTLVPMSNSMKAGAVAEVQTWNAWLHRYAAEQSIPLVDFYSILADPITGDWKAGYSADGVHGLSVPIVNMGRYAAQVLEPYMPPVMLPISQSNADTANMMINPMFTEGATVDGVPDGWIKVVTGGTGTISYALVDDTGIRGKWAQVTAAGYSANAGWGLWQPNKVSSWSVGDKIAISAYISVPSIGPGGSYYFYASAFQPESTLIKNLTQPLPETCMYYQETTLTSTTANLGFDANLRGGTGVMRIAQPTVYNLTKLGIA